MTTEARFELIAVTATADLNDAGSRFKVINLAGTICAAADVRAAGILRNAPKNTEQASAVWWGLAKGVAGGTVSTPGWPLKVANSGFVVAAASGDMTFGSFLDSCASGDLARVHADFMVPGYWHG